MMGSMICEPVVDGGMSEKSVSESRNKNKGDRGVADMIELRVLRWCPCGWHARPVLATSQARIYSTKPCYNGA
jgi:hypothetical protein